MVKIKLARVKLLSRKRQSLHGLRPLDLLRQGQVDLVERVACADIDTFKLAKRF